MGTSASNLNEYEKTREKPLEGVEATLYYFGGRGVADQIRWVLAAGNVSFGQKVVNTRELFLKMAERQLPFGQLPMLQIDGLELVQSQAIVRYIAKRCNLCGANARDEVKCDMIAGTIADAVGMALQAPFQRNHGPDKDAAHKQAMLAKWAKFGPRFEAVLAANGGKYLVGQSLTYADVLMVHCLTWYIEECGHSVANNLDLLVELQHKVFALPGVQAFIKSELYYPLGDNAYAESVSTVLGRKI